MLTRIRATFVLSAILGVAIAVGLDCPPIEINLDHGRLVEDYVSSTRIKVRIVCDEGYIPGGWDITVCEKGKWSRQLQECIPSGTQCPEPPEIENGRVHGKSRKKGAVVYYVCDENYFLVGPNSLECTWSYHWSRKPPVCQAEKESIETLALRLQSDFIGKVSEPSDDRQRIIGSEVRHTGLDLILVIDRSSSIDPRDFKIGIEFLKFLLQTFEVNNDPSNKAHFALITFGDKAEVVVNLNYTNINTTEKACEVLDKLTGEGGGTAMSQALEKVFRDIPIGQLRPESKKALFLMTDGQVNPNDASAQLLEDYANGLKESRGFEIFALGVGQDINKTQLALIASRPSKTHVFYLSKFEDFQKILWLVQNHPTPPPPPGPDKCGYIPPKPKNSKTPPSYDWPWLASILVTSQENEGTDTPTHEQTQFCSGVLLCTQWVLTVASCFDNTKNTDNQFISVFVGENDISKKEEYDLNLYAEEVVFHSDFNETSKDHNLALLRLNQEVPLNLTYRPICLQQKGYHPIPLVLDASAQFEIAGWGVPPVFFNDTEVTLALAWTLKSSSAKVIEQKQCNIFAKANGFQHLQSVFCADTRTVTNEHSCLGNLGSPLIHRNSDTNVAELVGILAWRDLCATLGFNAFINVLEYSDWINEVTENCQARHHPETHKDLFK